MLQAAEIIPNETKSVFYRDEINGFVNKNIKSLYLIRDNHKIWDNPLLKACMNGELTFEDFQFIFSQYYLYSKNFTRFLAALMVNCENDYYRSKLSENLWEEGGGSDIDQRHAEIFRYFLLEHLQIPSLEDIAFESYTNDFVQQYLHICLRYKPLEAAAALSLGTEGIVPRLYTIFRHGLRTAGLPETALNFFNLHIECDDDHALTLEEIVLSYSDQDNWLERCQLATISALNLRDAFFSRMYQDIQKNQKLNQLINNVSTLQSPHNLNIDQLKNCINFSGNLLYKNENQDAKINFKVQRMPFNCAILDSRLVEIPVGYNNEQHRHAHETIFLILSGKGKVIIEDQTTCVQAGDIIFVPRWMLHQTCNTGSENLKFFAITDFGFTQCFPKNNDTVYRLNKDASHKNHPN